jgi:hypothetical protein
VLIAAGRAAGTGEVVVAGPGSGTVAARGPPVSGRRTAPCHGVLATVVALLAVAGVGACIAAELGSEGEVVRKSSGMSAFRQVYLYEAAPVAGGMLQVCGRRQTRGDLCFRQDAGPAVLERACSRSRSTGLEMALGYMAQTDRRSDCLTFALECASGPVLKPCEVGSRQEHQWKACLVVGKTGQVCRQRIQKELYSGKIAAWVECRGVYIRWTVHGTVLGCMVRAGWDPDSSKAGLY